LFLASLKLLRVAPRTILNLIIFLNYAASTQVEFEICMLAFILFVIDVVGGCQDQIVGYKYSAAFPRSPKLIFEDEGPNPPMKTLPHFLLADLH
jgi:hypothetical protein